jgi:hypothetical protein
MAMTELTKRILETGCTEVTEEHVGLSHMLLIVDEPFVEAVRQLVCECVPVQFRVDVVGRGVPQTAG